MSEYVRGITGTIIIVNYVWQTLSLILHTIIRHLLIISMTFFLIVLEPLHYPSEISQLQLYLLLLFLKPRLIESEILYIRVIFRWLLSERPWLWGVIATPGFRVWGWRVGSIMVLFYTDDSGGALVFRFWWWWWCRGTNLAESHF